MDWKIIPVVLVGLWILYEFALQGGLEFAIRILGAVLMLLGLIFIGLAYLKKKQNLTNEVKE